MALIPTRIHGVLDYLSATALFLAPRALGWRPELTRPLAMAGAATVTYSLATRYEWGAFDGLSMPQHLACDAVQGAGFCLAAALLDRESADIRWALAGYGLFALAAAALTEREAPSARPVDWEQRRRLMTEAV
jgi:spore maturation protein SpmB